MSPVPRHPVPCRGRSASTPLPFPGRILGLDLGSRRIGVAASDSGQTVAVGVDTVARRADVAGDRRRLAGLVEDYEAVGVVVGLPLSLGGGEGPAAAAARAEVAVLGELLAVPVVTVDERLTTVTARAALRAGGRASRRQRSVVDRTAAAVILQAWLDGPSGPAGPGVHQQSPGGHR